MTPPRVVLSCEHAGNEVPSEYAHLFDSPAARQALDSHRGWDPGSWELGQAMAGVLDAPLVVQRVTRLLVECNRSLGHPRLFSEFSGVLGPEERSAVVERYWRPHRERVREAIEGVLEGAPQGGPVVVHVGVHTFTPVWKGRPRATDVGLLYDPRRAAEGALARRWREAMSRGTSVRGLPSTARGLPSTARGLPSTMAGGRLAIHLNRPYRGWTDGLTTALRQELPPDRYVGLELELSQRFAAQAGGLGRELGEALRVALEG
ncbi:MAG: N-formylglutamate amidohydrolase [Longimicrobiales bacterium]|nr:N-formylglutamate amidohydrolase [Longimicrobiales bacterium]